MRGDNAVVADGGTGAEVLEEVGSLGGEAEPGEVSGAKKFVSMQVFLPRKKAIQLEEIRLKRMKKGHDVSRSRLFSESVDLLAAREFGAKGGGKDE